MLIIVVDEVEPAKAVGWSSENLSQAITALSRLADSVKVVSTGGLQKALRDLETDRDIFCPLTTGLKVGDLSEKTRSLSLFSAIIQCGDTKGVRQLVLDGLGYETGSGNFWLPIVVTGKGPLYAEAISVDGLQGNYQQPFYLSDRQRQTIYRLGHRVLKLLDVPPAVYLLRLGLEADGKDVGKVWFDRVLPFPGEPAIASIGVQTPNLFECHWRCITGQPIRDITI
ncbi:MAG: hypothetical protein AAGA67_00270 [Cyanobacteria bacterium P01_F01_bin.153]